SPIDGQNWNVNTFSKVYDSNDLSSRYILAFPESSQPLGNSSFCWDDEKKAKKDIMISFNRLRSEHKLWDNPIVMSGFSQGAPFAIEYALDGGEIPAVGFIAIVPAVKDGDFAELSKLLEKAKRRSVKGIIIVGEHDVFWKEKGKRLYDYMIENGIQCKLVMSPKGHQFPDNFDKIVTEFMRSF
ncbi:MAG: hypothetical protein M1504_04120, partial [Candidatus Marsarchaeota archaeon]|nr:hypothetical protein [Candidatus Marsarchaeota archaeon]